MPLDEGELLLRTRQHVQKACQDVRSATSELGTHRDAAARDRLRRTRVFVHRCDSRVADLLRDVNPELKYMKDQYIQVKAAYDQLDTEALRRERQTHAFAPQHRRGGNDDEDDADRKRDAAVSGGSSRGGVYGDVDESALGERALVRESRQQPPQTYAADMAGLRTEEALQRAKLHSIREIESDVVDLKATYEEFHTLVHQQQEGLDVMHDNVTDARSLVQQGHTQLIGASRSQRRFRKFGCIAGIVLAVIAVVTIIVVIIVVRAS